MVSDFEDFRHHCAFNVDMLDAEMVRQRIKIKLMKDLLQRKPHYKKFFPNLEEEITMKPTQVMFQGAKTQDNVPASSYKAIDTQSFETDAFLDKVMSEDSTRLNSMRLTQIFDTEAVETPDKKEQNGSTPSGSNYTRKKDKNLVTYKELQKLNQELKNED